MRENDFIREIAAAWEALKSPLDIGRAFITPVSLPIDDIFQEIALHPESTYDEIYRTGLSRSNYNILLYDYAYFQFGWRTETSWRLAYFPNPWISGVPQAEQSVRHWETLEEIGGLAYEDASELISEMPYIDAVPPVRFEFASNEYREFAHPAAHFHIGRHTENRWPSSISLGPKAFTLIVAKLYYSNAWARCSSFHGSDFRPCLESALLTVLNHVRRVHDFSDAEARSFHFGRNMVVA